MICAFIAVAFTIRPIQAQAAGKLSVSDTKLWLNGEGQLVVTDEGHTDEELEVKAKAGSSVKIKTGKFNFKMKVVNSDGASDASSLDPGMEAWIPRENN